MKFAAYRAPDLPPMELVPANRFPPWMTGNTLPRSCLPMSIASSSGWYALNPTRVVVTWDGRPEPDALTVENDPYSNTAASIVGQGIVSWQIPYAIVTPPGWSTLVRGPANRPKDGVAPLEACVETDHAAMALGMSWQLTRPGTVTFEAGEPIAMLQPFRRHDLDMLEPEVSDMPADLLDQYGDWRCRRAARDRMYYPRQAQQKRVELRTFRHA